MKIVSIGNSLILCPTTLSQGKLSSCLEAHGCRLVDGLGPLFYGIMLRDRVSQLDISVLLPEDLPQIREMLVGQSIFCEVEVESAMAICGDAASCPFQEYYGYCLKAGGAVLGYIVFGRIPMTDRCWDLYWLAVTPANSRTGVGQRLVRYMESIVTASDGRQIHVETSSVPGFWPACRFYEKMGYRLAARLNDYYRPGADKLMYMKEVGLG